MTFTVAIVGKPNVGKSSLFNKLNGRRLAIVNDMPGVTRDSKEFITDFYDHKIKFIDTAGWEKVITSELSTKMTTQTLKAIEQTNLVIFLLDGKGGLTSDDMDFSRIIRRLGKPTMVVVNKCESKTKVTDNDIYKLGYGEPIYISSAHNLGIYDMCQKIISHKLENPIQQDETVDQFDTLKLAIIGRPNVGKSTLFNSIIGFERAITSDIPGTTRDAINYILNFEGRNIELIDTAGLRKKANIYEKIEELSSVETINAVRRSHIILLIIGADQPLQKQDLAIARIAINEGKPIVLVINKKDLIKGFKRYDHEIKQLIAEDLSEVVGLPVIYTQAITAVGVAEIFNTVLEVEKKWQSRISTPKLNKWLKEATTQYIPPLASNGRRIRLKYGLQTKIKPPSFSFYCNVPEDLNESYNKYLRNFLKKHFDLNGIPIRIQFHKNKNPYIKS